MSPVPAGHALLGSGSGLFRLGPMFSSRGWAFMATLAWVRKIASCSYTSTPRATSFPSDSSPETLLHSDISQCPLLAGIQDHQEPAVIGPKRTFNRASSAAVRRLLQRLVT